ncbi:MAG: aminomethyl-transferring glycine dehydrogenase subunit GcvPA [Actinomycetota bacterium]|nr:aminomethyl-transferring glycine dehydrogenase subunit GcvPA [Actinomycetota bacterium]
MEFVPHTDADDAAMLSVLGARSINDLFDQIPTAIRYEGSLEVPSGLSEPEVLRDLAALASRNRSADDLTCFLGAGAYDHHVPSMVWALLSRGEFATSYTPYQPELSQGVLQALFEYQTMVTEVTGLDISNASLYDGGSAVPEAVTMALAATKRRVAVLAGTVHPHYAQLMRTYARGPGIEVRTTEWGSDGRVDPSSLTTALDGAGALVVQHPNFLGVLEDVPELADATHAAGAKLIVHFDLTSAGILEAPGALGADIVVAEGQSLGNHLNFGGPYVGVIACRREDVRRLPGRLVGETVDRDGRRAFVLTLQAREQHIRREKATSNICTNQTLNALATAVTLAWLGPQGLRELGETCLAKAHYARERLLEIPGTSAAVDGPFFKEFAVRLPADPVRIGERAAADGFLAGLPVRTLMPDAGLDDVLLVAVTEKRSAAEIDAFAHSIARACKEES